MLARICNSRASFLGMKSGIATLRNSLLLSCKLIFAIQLSNFIPSYLPKGKESLGLKKAYEAGHGGTCL